MINDCQGGTGSPHSALCFAQAAERLRAGVLIGDLSINVQKHVPMIVQRADGMGVDVLLVKGSGLAHGRLAVELFCESPKTR